MTKKKKFNTNIRQMGFNREREISVFILQIIDFTLIYIEQKEREKTSSVTYPAIWR
jgi:hypothetical protein